MVRAIDPRIGETVYDPGCGTGGFLVQSYEDDCVLWSILSLPPGTFINAGAGVKANLLFFTKSQTKEHFTERIWHYDLSDINDAGSLRRVLPAAARPRRQRAQLDGG